MRKIANILLIICSLTIAYQIRSQIISDYRWEKYYCQAWNLADKSSTIPAKQAHIAEFISLLKSNARAFASHDAVWLKTPNNSFEQNLSALATLGDRLTQIQEMNPSSFEYNTAIQQITAQEQGEAHAMMSVFKGCWELENYTIIWGWIGGLVFCGALIGIVFGGGVYFVEWGII